MPPDRVIQKKGDYSLRKATNADRPAIWALISSVLRSYGITTNEQTTDKDLVDIEANYWDSKGAFFLLLRGEEVIGTVALHYETDAVCEICRMYLAPQYRGQGLGRRLLEHCVSEARERGFEEMCLKTASVLVEAISLYKRAGFTVVEGAEAGGNCDLVMKRSLRA
jgi:N-acetylglutamate synthase-like GNAT family acetyltransferase